MSTLTIIVVLISLCATFAYFNYKLLKMPTTIGIMLGSLIFSLVVVVLGDSGLKPYFQWYFDLSSSIDFYSVLMEGMLGILLFCGALHVDINDLRSQKSSIFSFATLGVALSTIIVACLFWGLCLGFGIEIQFIHALLFGALISPTDPIAVLGILKKLKAPKSLEIKFTGESLFNDGVGVVLFILIYQIAFKNQDFDLNNALLFFVQEVGGGILFGLALGGLAYLLLKSVSDYFVTILVTLSLVLGGYLVANYFHLSGALAMVIAGLLLGNKGKALSMSSKSKEYINNFWELLDELLNAVLFLMIGLEITSMNFDIKLAILALLTIPVVLLSRLISVSAPIQLLRYRKSFEAHLIKVLTWGGLRGGISVALALSIPQGPIKDTLLIPTYLVVLFSILVQGMTIKPLMLKLGVIKDKT